MRNSWVLLGAPLFAAALILGCGDDNQGTSTGNTAGTGGSAGTAGAAGDTTSSNGGTGGSAGTAGTGGTATTGGSAGTAGTGGTGGSAGPPWEGHIDPQGGPSSGRLVAHQLGSTSAPQGFYEYTPAGYPDNVKWPLLIANHGIGENGNGTDQLVILTNSGIPKLLKNDKWPNDRPLVVLAPQHSGGGCPGPDEIQSFIAWAVQNYEIDPHYVYLTGLSCGAIGSWSYLDKYLDSQIAAYVSVAGDDKQAWADKMCELGKVPIWAFHGDADPTVDVSGTNVPMDGLAQCPKPPAMESKKTIYPGVGHDSWTMTYDGSAGNDPFAWMLGFKKP